MGNRFQPTENRAVLISELKQAQITHQESDENVTGELSGWTFKREWGYWVAETGPSNGLDQHQAENLCKNWHNQIRLRGIGRIGRKRVTKRDLWPLGTIFIYHIDTQEGLNTFAHVLRGIDLLKSA